MFDMMNCPLPKFDFDIITLGHGSGGALTHQLLRSGVFDILKNDLLDQQHDGASFELNGRVAFSTDSYVVSPIFFPGGNIGDLAINGTVNDLAMCGAMAKYLSLSFIIEEGLYMEEFARILQSIKIAASAAGVSIVTGDTKVVEKGKGDRIFINTSGIGYIHPRASIHHKRIRTGDKIILSGQLAHHGITIMSMRSGLDFETDIISDTRPLNHVVMSLLNEFGESIKFLRDPTRGGLASVLNEIAGLTPYGYQLQQDNILLDERVEGACEMLGLDPLYVANEGVFVLVADSTVAEDIVVALKNDPAGKEAMIIGEVVSDHPGKVVIKSRAGGRRVVGMLAGEQLPRIC
jgi:hydrogenase expression/formation protein HypE